MDQQNKSPDNDMRGWAVAYYTNQGPEQLGYLGRLEKDEHGIAVLDDAIEFASIVQPGRNGGAVRSCHGTPLEFTASLKRVKVRYLYLVELDGLAKEERGVYHAALREAAEAEKSLRQTRGENLVQPVSGQGLVGPSGAPLAAGGPR